MSGNRRNPPLKYTLPDVIDPPERVCFTIEVPNNLYHIGAFRGALQRLASAIFWADDSAHTAKQVALVWRDVVDNVRVCDDSHTNTGITLEDFMSQQIRISPDDSCIIQMWCIDHWENWYDPRSCIVGEVTQPTDGTPPEPGECRTWDVTLQGNSQWLLPIPLNSGMTISVESASGAWSDGTLQWNCPDGKQYFAGICGTPEPGEVTDPIPSANHMRLIANADGTYIDAYNRTLSIPSGITDGVLIFQANDGSIEGNAGSIQFRVTACNTTETEWTHTIDFKVTEGEFEPNVDAGNERSEWESGVGWKAIYIASGNYKYSFVQRDFDIPFNLTGLTLICDMSGADAPSGPNFVGYYDQSFNYVILETVTNATNITKAWAGSVTCNRLAMDLQVDQSGSNGNGAWTKMIVTGKGYDPFA